MKNKLLSSSKAKSALYALAVLAAYLVADSNFHLKVTDFELSFDTLPPEFDGLNIALISDLHGMSYGKNNTQLVKAIRLSKPDIIAIVGDAINSKSHLHVFEQLLKDIVGIAPIYFVNGNHEWKAACTQRLAIMFSNYNIRYLRDEYEAFLRGQGRIIIAGIEDAKAPFGKVPPMLLAEKLRRDFPNDFVLWLSHRNNSLRLFPDLPVDLVLSGHAHGGVIRLPFIGGLLNTNRTFFSEYENGVYNEGGLTLVVSRGLGNSNCIPRFLNRPELVCIHLRRSQRTK